MDDNNKYVVISIIAVLLLACAAVNYIGYQQVLKDNPNFWQEYNELKTDEAYQAQRQAESDAMADKVFPYAVGIVLIFVVLIFGGDVVKALGRPLLILMGGIALLGAIAYFVGFADQNGDGVRGSRVVEMVQPTGNDVQNDRAYAEVNTVNADATMKNSVSVVIIWIAFGIVVFIIGFVAQFFNREL
jgi:hypothetical protein